MDGSYFWSFSLHGLIVNTDHPITRGKQHQPLDLAPADSSRFYIEEPKLDGISPKKQKACLAGGGLVDTI